MGLTRSGRGFDPTDLDRLQRLSALVGVSGAEGPVRELVRESVEQAVASLHVDALGNLIARVNPGADLRVMVAAHMDEVGFMVTGVDSDGRLRFDKVGGVDPRYLPGAPVWIGPRRRPGVIGVKPIHLTSNRERKSYPDLDSLRIDLGFADRDAAQEHIQLGDGGTFASPARRVGDRLWAKALDDRVGVATLIRLLHDPPPGIELIGAFTVQEEIGLRGARVAAQAEAPDLAFVLDCTPARDIPGPDGSPNSNYNARFDGGPTVYVADRGTVSDPRLVRLLESTADEEGLSIQRRQPGGGRTDAAAIHVTGKGVPSVSLSVPARYLHSSAAQIRLEAWEDSYLLIDAALRRLPSFWPEELHG